MQLFQSVKRLLIAAAMVGGATLAAGGAQAAPRQARPIICASCHLVNLAPVLQGVTYDWYYLNELDVFADNLTPYNYARIVIADSVPGQVLRTDHGIVSDAGALISIGADGNPVDGTMIFYPPLTECGAYPNPVTGTFDPLSIQVFDGATGLGSNMVYYHSGCV